MPYQYPSAGRYQAASRRAVGPANGGLSKPGHTPAVAQEVGSRARQGGEQLRDVYNIADAKPVKLWDLIDQMMDATGVFGVKQTLPMPLALVAARLVEYWVSLTDQHNQLALSRQIISLLTRTMTLNIDKARHQLGYQPRDRLYKAIEDFARIWNNP